MYGWMWRKLPGGWPLKTLQALVLIVGISTLLVVVVFPWVEPKLPFSGNTVDGTDTSDTNPGTPAPSNTTQAPSPTDVPAPSDTGGDVLPGD